MSGPSWLDRICEFDLVEREICGRTIRFIIERTLDDWCHACTVLDIVHLLEALPASDWVGLHTFVLRQPTRKQKILSPTWGRLRYFAKITSTRNKVLATGPAVYLEAIKANESFSWSTSLDPQDAQELERLREDGHGVIRSGHKYTISTTVESTRNTQLYRTLIHEIGHWFDWLSKVEEPCAKGGDYHDLERRYFARPRAEREAFAHRYADLRRAALIKAGRIPFARIA